MQRDRHSIYTASYIAIFLYFFLLRPAPEQILQGEVAVGAAPVQLASVVNAQGGDPLPLLTICPLKMQIARWIAGQPISASSLLTNYEEVRFRVEPRPSGSVVKAEMRWQPRGGMLGKALDTLLARGQHETALSESLRTLKAAAEATLVHRAALQRCTKG